MVWRAGAIKAGSSDLSEKASNLRGPRKLQALGCSAASASTNLSSEARTFTLHRIEGMSHAFQDEVAAKLAPEISAQTPRCRKREASGVLQSHVTGLLCFFIVDARSEHAVQSLFAYV